MQGPFQELEKQAFEHAWKWFEYHATQRMTTIRFYLIIAGAIATGVGYLWSSHYYSFATVLSTFGIVASISFRRLDLRVSHLVKLGEAALKQQQNKMAAILRQPDLEICERADQMNAGCGGRNFVYPYSYSENISLLFGSSILAFSIACLMCLLASTIK